MKKKKKKKKVKGPNNPLPTAEQPPSQSQPLPPIHKKEPPQSYLARSWCYTKTLGMIVLKWLRIVRECFRAVLEISAILGIVAFYYQFSPNLSVTPHAGFSGSDPFRTPFVISNNSYLDFTNVRTSCFLLDVKYDRGPTFGRVRVSSGEGKAALVAAGELLTVKCELEKLANMGNRELLFADIQIDVTFEVFPYNYMRDERKTFRFIATKADNAHWFWIPQPIGKP